MIIMIITIISFFIHGNHISYILHVNVSVLELMCGWLYSLVTGMDGVIIFNSWLLPSTDLQCIKTRSHGHLNDNTEKTKSRH